MLTRKNTRHSMLLARVQETRVGSQSPIHSLALRFRILLSPMTYRSFCSTSTGRASASFPNRHLMSAHPPNNGF
jgi:hypothetical protein